MNSWIQLASGEDTVIVCSCVLSGEHIGFQGIHLNPRSHRPRKLNSMCHRVKPKDVATGLERRREDGRGEGEKRKGESKVDKNSL